MGIEDGWKDVKSNEKWKKILKGNWKRIGREDE
jgi:hypothetical protein